MRYNSPSLMVVNDRTSGDVVYLVVITTAQLHSTKSELRFCAGSNPACGVSEICDSENLWQWSRLEIRRKHLSSVNHSAKTIHHQFVIITQWYNLMQLQKSDDPVKSLIAKQRANNLIGREINWKIIFDDESFIVVLVTDCIIQ